MAMDVCRLLIGEEVLKTITAYDFSGIVLSLCSSVGNVLFNLFILGCLRLWTNRNSVIHGSVGWTAADMVTSFGFGKTEVGIIIRDHNSTVIAAKSSLVLGCSSVDLLEAQACLKGLQLAIDVGIFGMVLESDAATVIKLLSGHIVPRTEMGALIRNSLALGASVNLLAVEAFWRGANSVAYSLAQLAHSLDGSVVRLEELPTDASRLVRLDSASFGCFALVPVLPKKNVNLNKIIQIFNIRFC
ncbi:hypothetical protein Ddye_017538 [Dipteronia dyeriana]|uniref:RNase H type-1 domain-containing protein n=1 Tax=Dipteronia dyeriana TaxID=168575 RepID=A0AAD9U9E7_9ROSI|nr:hypothetical protein Ddye_017538 [Dipteronia dyeriana]